MKWTRFESGVRSRQNVVAGGTAKFGQIVTQARRKPSTSLDDRWSTELCSGFVVGDVASDVLQREDENEKVLSLLGSRFSYEQPVRSAGLSVAVPDVVLR